MAKPTPAPADTAPVADFEHSLDELEQLVARMEGGDMSLDESLSAFERRSEEHTSELQSPA